MTRFVILTLILLDMALSARAQKIYPSNRPNECQTQMRERAYGMFIHFGLNTFLEKEWSDGTDSPEVYCPSALDCDQWVKSAADAGFRYILLVTKHHDGFCLWDSKLTDYDVASSPVPTDVVGEVAKACRKYGLALGFYYSLWDRHEPSYQSENFNDYIDYMCGQLEELLTNYGEICEVWLDGAWDRPAPDWDVPRIYNLIKEHNPLCAVAVNGNISETEVDKGGFIDVLPDRMIEDNIFRMRYFPSDFRLWDPKIASRRDAKQYLHQGGSYYLPFEHTICISKFWNWFQKTDNNPVRDLEELEELFYWATANGNSLVVNIPPDKTGRLRQHEVMTAISLSKRLGLDKDKPLPTGGRYLDLTAYAPSVWKDMPEFTADHACDGGLQTRWASADPTPSIEFMLQPGDKFDKITIFEFCDTDSPDGIFTKRKNRIQAYNIEYFSEGEWKTLYVSDTPMNDCATIRLPYSVAAEKVRLNITQSTLPPSIYEFNLIDTSEL